MINKLKFAFGALFVLVTVSIAALFMALAAAAPPI
jgi:hypothetical protein